MRWLRIKVTLEPIARDIQQTTLGLARSALADTAMFDSVRTSAHNGRDQQQHPQAS